MKCEVKHSDVKIGGKIYAEGTVKDFSELEREGLENFLVPINTKHQNKHITLDAEQNNESKSELSSTDDMSAENSTSDESEKSDAKPAVSKPKRKRKSGNK